MKVVSDRADLVLSQIAPKTGEDDVEKTYEVETWGYIAAVSAQPGIEHEQVARRQVAQSRFGRRGIAIRKGVEFRIQVDALRAHRRLAGQWEEVGQRLAGTRHVVAIGSLIQPS